MVPQPRHYWHYGLNNSLSWGAILRSVEFLAAFLASTWQISVADPTATGMTSVTTNNVSRQCQISPGGWGNHPHLRTTGVSKDIGLRLHCKFGTLFSKKCYTHLISGQKKRLHSQQLKLRQSENQEEKISSTHNFQWFSCRICSCCLCKFKFCQINYGYQNGSRGSFYEGPSKDSIKPETMTASVCNSLVGGPRKKGFIILVSVIYDNYPWLLLHVRDGWSIFGIENIHGGFFWCFHVQENATHTAWKGQSNQGLRILREKNLSDPSMQAT